MGVVSALAAGTRLLIFFIGRMETLMGHAGIVENLRLNHNGKIIHKGQIFFIFPFFEQIFQSIDILGFDVFRNDNRAFRRRRFHLSNILCFGDDVLILFLLSSGRHRQIDAQHAQAKNNCHDLCKFSFKAF